MSSIDTIMNLKNVVLSILFVSGDGIEKSFIAEKLEVSEKEVDKAIGVKKGVHRREWYTCNHL